MKVQKTRLIILFLKKKNEVTIFFKFESKIKY